ncbi:MAG: DUF1553 domain-containing protein, partial [Planctomycetes bacterium]|nr:DUF1553 domain-containing protein [Planctomycetota bacterium]
DANKKGDVAPRSFLSVIDAARPQIAVGSSGRLELARWVASPDNPLTMRVIVNRVWQYHFGKGLVATSSNFGRQSPPPSHPELLDWLARDFIDHRLSLKHLHRRIMSSAVYQLGSTHNADNAQRDEANRLYWRFDRQRMDAETLRDSLLAVSGSLERGSGGRHPFKPTEELKYTQGNPFTETFEHNRRSVYLMNPRLNKHPFMALYDGPDTNKSTEQRAASTVSLQSLHMLNSAFIEQQAAAFAARISAATSDVAGRLQLAYELALARPPDETERARATGYLQTLTADLQSEGRPLTEAERLAWTSFARALLASNEFIYVD